MPLRRVSLQQAQRALRLVWDAAGPYVAVWGILLLVQGLLPVGTAYLTKPLVNALAAAVGGGGGAGAVETLAWLAGGMAVLILAGELIKSALQWVSLAQSELVQDHVSDLIHEKATRVDMGSFESAEFLDKLYRVRADASGRPLALLEGFGSLVQNSITVVGIGALLLPYGLWLALALLVGTLPTFVVVLRASRQYHDWWQDTTTSRRRAQYMSSLLTEPANAPDVRTMGLGEHFRALFRGIRRTLREERLRILRQQTLRRLGAEGVALLVSAGTIGWMVLRAVAGRATLGDVALFYQAFQRGQGLVRALFGNINQLHSNGLFLGELFEFLDLEPLVSARVGSVDSLPTDAGEIRFERVSFRYPGTEKPTVAELSLTIGRGRVVAIVGSNGAGKSTLLKLLARFYDPDEGRITIDGVDVRSLEPSSIHKRLTVLFQAPLHFHGSARENVELGAAGEPSDRRRTEQSLRDAGALSVVERLPRGLDSLLGRSFPDGTELSGGEWQRLTLARALYRGTKLIVLDEPTSHLDAWSEAKWLEDLRVATRGATVIIITHRLTIASRADEVHVLEGGRIVESGTHSGLIAKKGRYADAWDSSRGVAISTQGS